jgi:hypothetical protein
VKCEAFASGLVAHVGFAGARSQNKTHRKNSRIEKLLHFLPVAWYKFFSHSQVCIDILFNFVGVEPH